MNHIVINHAKLVLIRCVEDAAAPLVKLLGLPYAAIPQRFSRSRLAPSLNDPARDNARVDANGVFDATRPGECSIQPWGSVRSDA
ncbi:hypothetical protein T440DRAFT_539894 [Plenodomus tracheiphilus IPT5]|uniref:Uncharacterized protein n=1 Tax=Plenodomus tracheiphilus IPT5 TaxID=1408161 RepID=A0A6A7AVL8_9PLEO|nr:hypothetical protein T440DRAFT_539894 [Plenodomus tracheiphilus IPT5]